MLLSQGQQDQERSFKKTLYIQQDVLYDLFRIDFLKIFDVDNDNESNYFDHYIYKTLKVWVSIGEKKSSFKLDLPNFQRLLRLKLTVSEHEKGISLILEDTDYQAKQAFYKAASKIW